jgi:PTH1 family peptidyl-tRNA hydrolase
MISLILGLGNIGEKYVGTRHNVGFEVVERVRAALNIGRQPAINTYDWAVRADDERRLILAWPRMFMNLCGLAAGDLLQDSDLQPENMLVVVDDFNLPLGRIRIRPSGSDGGHKGLSSLIETLQTEDFPRLRLGIGPAPDNLDTVGFVLSKFEKNEIEPVKKMIDTAVEAVLYMIGHRLEEAMAKYNVNPAQPEAT